WSPSWVYVLLLAGLLPFLIVALILTRRMRVLAPLCDAHRNHWLGRALITWGSLFGLLLLGFTAGALSELLGPPGETNPLTGYLCGGMIAGLLVWLVVAAVLQTTAIQVVEITDTSITLSKV